MTNPGAAPGRTAPVLRWRTVVAIGVLALLVALPAVVGAVGADAPWVPAYAGSLMLLAGVSTFLVGLRQYGRLRAAWWLVSACAVVTTLTHATVGGGATPVEGSPALRLLALLGALAAMLTFPGTVDGLRRWLLLGLDGWLLGGSLFVVVWLVGVGPEALLEAPADLAMSAGWLVADLALASTVLAVTRRMPEDQRAGGALLTMLAVLISLGDAGLALGTGAGWTPAEEALFVGGWTAAAVVLLAMPWVAPDPFHGGVSPVPRSARSGPGAPYVTACLAIAASIVAWALGRPSDPVLSVVVLTLLWSLVSSQVLLAIENGRLVAQVSRQADMFRRRATQDGLTGLPNRSEFTGRVQSALVSPGRGNVAVLFIDLDGFKDVNDSFGHAVGDELLIEAATRLASEVRESDVVARFGGDEFVALLADCSDESALEIAERLRESLSRPYGIGHRDVVVSASIGLARPTGDDDAESALRNADLALYRAKKAGRDRVSVYRPEMHSSALRRLDAAGRLRDALVHDRLSLAYQPIVDLRTGKVYAVEALLRFHQEDLADWSVSEVIEAAEESGLIVPVGGWVLDAAVRTLGRWLRAGIETRVNVNVSARQLEQGGQLALQVENALLCHQVPPDRLCLEITEHQLVRDLDHSTVELDKIRELGVRVTLDDFGTGYSSLSYLPRLPLDGLKIDRALTSRIGSARDTVPAVLRLGRDLGLSVVAEGVERPEQLALLRASGCTLGQGHLLSLPLAEAEATELLRDGSVALPGVSASETARVIR